MYWCCFKVRKQNIQINKRRIEAEVDESSAMVLMASRRSTKEPLVYYRAEFSVGILGCTLDYVSWELWHYDVLGGRDLSGNVRTAAKAWQVPQCNLPHWRSSNNITKVSRIHL